MQPFQLDHPAFPEVANPFCQHLNGTLVQFWQFKLALWLFHLFQNPRP